MKYWKGDKIDKLEENQIFVFGSNPQARHFAGAAKAALKFGAKPIKRNGDGSVKEKGVGRGLHGKTYALVTKNLEDGYFEEETGITYHSSSFRSVSIEQLTQNVKEFYDCAKNNSSLEFLVVYQYDVWPNGSPKKSLNGYDGEDMINIFVSAGDIPKNIVFHESYQKKLEEKINSNNKQNEKEVKFNYLENYKSKGFTYFWHSPSPFSQWHPSIFSVKNANNNDVLFSSAEQFMMYCKAKLFKDEAIANEILNINNKEGTIVNKFIKGEITKSEILSNKEYKSEWDNTQKKIKNLGREVKNYDENIWKKNRVKLVSRGNLEKFTQNEDLKRDLLNTKNTILVEANPYDKIWAIALNEYDQRAKDPQQWLGKNLLGKILTHLKRKFQLELNVDQEIEKEPKKLKM